MKQKIYLVLTGLFLFTLQLSAQAPPQALNYQGVARDASGLTLPDQPIGLRFTIHQASGGGTSVYQETHSDTTNGFGLFTTAIGSGTVVSGNFSTISWGADTYYLQVEMDPSGGSNYKDMGTTQFLSVPYALYAASSGGVGATLTAIVPLYITGTNNAPVISIQGTGINSGGVLYSTGEGSPAAFTSTGTAGQVLQSNGTAAPTWVTPSNSGTPGWSLTGNSGTTPGTNFIGTTDNIDFVTKTNNVERMRVTKGGNVGIGTSTPATDAGVAIKGLHLEAQAGTTAPTISVNPINIGIGGSGTFNASNGGTDVGGSIDITTGGAAASAGQIITVNFGTPYITAPVVVISPTDATTATSNIDPYVTSTTTGFDINFGNAPVISTSYNFNYFVIETK